MSYLSFVLFKKPGAVKKLYKFGQSILLLMFASTAWGQVVPDAGSVRQQIDAQRQPALPLPQGSGLSVESPPLKPRSNVQILVKGFRFVGNTLLDDASLAIAVAPWVGARLGFDGLQRAIDAITTAYRDAGWIVRVYLPEQEVTDGVIAIQVLEARYAGLRMEGEAVTRIGTDLIEAPFKIRQKLGQPLDTAALDRALLLVNDLPGVRVTGVLVSGDQDGETALSLRATDEALLSGNVSLDNAGARATGSLRTILEVNFNSPWGWGEQIGLNLLRSDGSEYASLRAMAPLGDDGLRVGFNASTLRYHVVDGPAAASAARIAGQSDGLGIVLSYPLIRSRTRNLYISSTLEEKTFFTQDSVVRSDYLSDSLHADLAGNWLDDFGGVGVNMASLRFTSGRLSRMSAHPQLGSIDSSYRKLTYAISRQQSLWPGHSLHINFSGQYATQVLDSSEKLFIGGAGSVRAYPVSELGGDRGQLAGMEWRWDPVPKWSLSAFLDWARVESLSALPSEATTASLSGYGVGVRWKGPAGLIANVSWSRRSGQNPHPTSTGSDGDGTLRKNRVWASVALPF